MEEGDGTAEGREKGKKEARKRERKPYNKHPEMFIVGPGIVAQKAKPPYRQ